MPFDLDLDKLKAKPPLRDVTFYVAVLASILLLLLDFKDGYTQGSLATDALPLSAWLTGHGYLRGKAAGAAGDVAKAQIVSRIGGFEDVPVESNAAAGTDQPKIALVPSLAVDETVEDYSK